MTSSESYVVECTKCSETKSANGFETVRDFAFKHQKHTGHPVEWTRTNIDPELSKILDLVYHIECDECGETWLFEQEGEAKNFYEEHATVTDHEPSEIRHIERGIRIKKPEDLLKLVNRINTRTDGEDGAPRDVIIRAVQHRGGRVDKVERWLNRLSQQGELYEPTPNYYRQL